MDWFELYKQNRFDFREDPVLYELVKTQIELEKSLSPHSDLYEQGYYSNG